jgi:hypothetical protein
MEDDHPKLLAFAVGLIIALVLWIVMGGVSGILWDYMLLPACDGSLWAGKVIGVRSRDLQLGEALLASGVPDYLVPGALMGWPAEPLEWYFATNQKRPPIFGKRKNGRYFHDYIIRESQDSDTHHKCSPRDFEFKSTQGE